MFSITLLPISLEKEVILYAGLIRKIKKIV